MKLEALPIFPKLTVESRNLSSVTIRKNGALKASVPVNGKDIMAPLTVSMLKCSIIQDIASQILLFLPSLHIFASQFILIPSIHPFRKCFSSLGSSANLLASNSIPTLFQTMVPSPLI